MRLILLLAFLLCGFLLNTNYAYTQEIDNSDIYITPETDTAFFSGYIGGDAAGSYDWAIGNGVPYGPITKDMVFSTYDGSSFQERMCIATTGNVGIGTTSPSTQLHISETGARASVVVQRTDGKFVELLAGLNFTAIGFDNSNRFQIGPVGAIGKIPANSSSLIVDSTGNVGIGAHEPEYPLEMGSGAHVTTGGVWTNASSRDYKENIRELTAIEAKKTLEELRPTKFNYKVEKEDEYLGFIAEDVPELVATKDRKGLSPMDITAVLTKVVQEQQIEIQEQQNKMGSMEKEMELLKSTMKQLLEK